VGCSGVDCIGAMAAGWLVLVLWGYLDVANRCLVGANWLAWGGEMVGRARMLRGILER